MHSDIMVKKRKTKRKASAFALRVGKFRKQGKTFKQAVRLAKSGSATVRRRKRSVSRKVNKVRARTVSMVKRRRSKGRSKGLGIPNVNKLLKIAVFSVAAATLGAAILPSVSPQIRAAAGGFFAGGPVGAAIGFVAQPALSNLTSGLLNGGQATGGPAGVGAFV